MARPKRFELLTPRFVVWCSIQLSYGRVFRGHSKGMDPAMPHAFGELSKKVAKARHSYRLRPGLASSGNASDVLSRQENAAKQRLNAPNAGHDQARARSLRTLSSSTGRSGITIRNVAPRVPSTRWMSPPWA